MTINKDEDMTGTTPAGGQQHGSSSGDGGTVGTGKRSDDGLRHPRPDTPESKAEHQADQPGVAVDREGSGS
jgi:hypothetical protein